MSRYADLDALEKELNERLTFLRERNGNYDQYTDGFDEAVDRVENFQTADVAPVVHARWIRPHWQNSNYCCDCSECGGEAMHREYQWDKNGIYSICPNCGAKMNNINEENNKGEVK